MLSFSRAALKLLMLCYLCAPLHHVEALGAPVASETPDPSRKALSARLEKLKTLRLKHSVDGFEESCDGRYLVTWGKPLVLNKSLPRVSEVTIFAIVNWKKTAVGEVDRGIFNAKFLMKSPFVYLETDVGTLFGLHSGVSQDLPADVDPDQALDYDICERTQAQSFRRYSTH